MNKLKTILYKAIAATMALVPVLFISSAAHAAVLTTASLTLGDPRPSQTVVGYDFKASNVTTSTIKCIQWKFTVNADGTGGVPTGMDTTVGAVAFDSANSNYLASWAGWTLDKTTQGTLKLTEATGGTPASSSARTVAYDGITNGSTTDDDFFLTFSTYNNVDCSTSPVDSVTAAYIYTNGQAVSLTVDPSLAFTITGKSSGSSCNSATTNQTTTATTIPLGTPTTSTNRIAAQDLNVTTNAGNGYTVFTRYTAQPTSGSNTISDHTGTNASPTAFSAAGTESFGYTTNDATLGTGTADRFTSAGGNKWAQFTTANLEIAYSAAAVSNETTCAGYQVGINGTTEAGTYTTTVIFTAVPIF